MLDATEEDEWSLCSCSMSYWGINLPGGLDAYLIKLLVLTLVSQVTAVVEVFVFIKFY